MSAADPAHALLNEADDAPVISLDKHRTGAARTARERWNRMTTSPPQPAPPPGEDGRSPLEMFASDIEMSFNAIDQSLTEPRTAATFSKTLDVWQRILEGSHAQGIIDDQQLHELAEILEGMRQAPRLV